eukprot:jgi/Tetstr1/445565/TSEL_033338.t1
MWHQLAEGLLPAYDQLQPRDAAVDQLAATPADNLARAGVRAWAEYEADPDADDAVICPPTRTLLTLLEDREVWKARRSADSGRAVIQVTSNTLNEEREDPPPTPHYQGVLPPTSSKQCFRCALTVRAICTGPLANLELPTVEQLAKAIAATISQRINTPPELQHAQWLTDTMMAAGIEMQQYHTEPNLLRVGDDNLCDISSAKRTRSKGKAAASAKHKKKQPRGRRRLGGANRNRSMSKPRLSGTRDSDSEWETDNEADNEPSGSSHQ